MAMDCVGVALALTISGMLLTGAATEDKRQGDANVKTHIEQLEQEEARAFSHNDRGWFDKHEMSDYLFVDPDGTVWNKADWLNDMSNFNATSEISSLRISVEGDAAVAVYGNKVSGTRKGKDISGDSVESDYWLRQGAEWKMLGSQITAVHH